MATSFSATSYFLVVNGVPQASDVPAVSTLLESLPGAYTTTRTHGNASILLFWERHLRRLFNSARILADHRPDLFGAPAPVDLSAIGMIVDESMHVGLGLALAERGRRAEAAEKVTELAVTALICGGVSGSSALDLYLHIGFYVPPVFGAAGARLALAGRGRDVAEAKYSQWARIRKDMEKMRPPMVTELLLSNDGDRILEGSVTNFFVVCKADCGKADDSTYDLEEASSFVVQTAPISDGVLPGVIRQLVIEVCSSMGIPLREVAPSWSGHELWKESFITSKILKIQSLNFKYLFHAANVPSSRYILISDVHWAWHLYISVQVRTDLYRPLAQVRTDMYRPSGRSVQVCTGPVQVMDGPNFFDARRKLRASAARNNFSKS